MNVRFRDPRDSDADLIRPIDWMEAHVLTGRWDVNQLIRESIAASREAAAAEIDGQFAAVFGVVPLTALGGTGVPWLMGSAVLDRHPRVLIGQARQVCDALHRGFQRLTNLVWAEHRESVRMLRWLGFEIAPAAPVGPSGCMFHRFTSERCDV